MIFTMVCYRHLSEGITKGIDEYSVYEIIEFLVNDKRILSSLIGMKSVNRVAQNIAHISIK